MKRWAAILLCGWILYMSPYPNRHFTVKLGEHSTREDCVMAMRYLNQDQQTNARTERLPDGREVKYEVLFSCDDADGRPARHRP